METLRCYPQTHNQLFLALGWPKTPLGWLMGVDCPAHTIQSRWCCVQRDGWHDISIPHQLPGYPHLSTSVRIRDWKAEYAHRLSTDLRAYPWVCLPAGNSHACTLLADVATALEQKRGSVDSQSPGPYNTTAAH